MDMTRHGVIGKQWSCTWWSSCYMWVFALIYTTSIWPQLSTVGYVHPAAAGETFAWNLYLFMLSVACHIKPISPVNQKDCRRLFFEKFSSHSHSITSIQTTHRLWMASRRNFAWYEEVVPDVECARVCVVCIEWVYLILMSLFSFDVKSLKRKAESHVLSVNYPTK